MINKRLQLLIGLLALMIIPFVSAAVIQPERHLNLQFTNADGDILTGSALFNFTISENSDCSSPIYQNFTNLTTDDNGIISYYLRSVPNPANNTQRYLCIYRNHIFESNFSVAPSDYAIYALNISANGILDDSNINVPTHNVTAQRFNGLFNWTVGASSAIYIAFDGATLSFNETRLNQTISDLGVRIGFNTSHPAGSNTQIQFNRNGVLAGNASFYFDEANSAFFVGFNQNRNIFFVDVSDTQLGNQLGVFQFIKQDGQGDLDFSNVTGPTKNFKFRNESGTLALLSDIKPLNPFDQSLNRSDSPSFKVVNASNYTVSQAGIFWYDSSNNVLMIQATNNRNIYVSNDDINNYLEVPDASEITANSPYGFQLDNGTAKVFKANSTDSYVNNDRISIWLHNQTSPVFTQPLLNNTIADYGVRVGFNSTYNASYLTNVTGVNPYINTSIASGVASVQFNETKLNQTISDLGVRVGFNETRNPFNQDLNTTNSPTFRNMTVQNLTLTRGQFTQAGLGAWVVFDLNGAALGQITSTLGVFQFQALGNTAFYFTNDDNTNQFIISDSSNMIARSSYGFSVDNGATTSLESNNSKTTIYNNATFSGAFNNFTRNVNIVGNATVESNLTVSRNLHVGGNLTVGNLISSVYMNATRDVCVTGGTNKCLNKSVTISEPTGDNVVIYFDTATRAWIASAAPSDSTHLSYCDNGGIQWLGFNGQCIL